MEANPGAEWKPYVIADEYGEVHSYIYGKTSPCIVVRKGYEHPEIVMKIMTALFDNARYRHDGSEEIDLYQKRGIDISARPLVANCVSAMLCLQQQIISGWLCIIRDRQIP